MHPTIERWWLNFLRYGLCVDVYLARQGGNHEFVQDSINRISKIDMRLDQLAINS